MISMMKLSKVEQKLKMKLNYFYLLLWPPADRPTRW